jgi:hypothetical protein
MAENPEWRFRKFGLLVTGEGEELFLPRMFRSLSGLGGGCTFKVIRRIGQLSPRTVAKQARLQVTGTQKRIPSRDEELGLAARGWLDSGGDYVLLIDDLEHDRAGFEREIFNRYRQALDTILGHRRERASVHFLVNMLEAYYFADAKALNAVLGLEPQLVDESGDVERLRHPKNELKRLSPGFDEKRHGQQVMVLLDVEHVLSRPETCASLRVLFAWCMKALGQSVSRRYRLDTGVYALITGAQLR